MRTVLGLRFSSPERPLTTNHKIFRAIVIVGACSIIAKLAATAKELAVAGWFARSDALDAFLIAFLLPSFVVGIVAGSLNGAFIPAFIHARENEGKEAAQRLFSSTMVLTAAALGGVAILLGIFAPYFLPLVGLGFSPHKLMLSRQILYLLLPFVFLSGLVTVWSAVLSAGEQFLLPAVTPTLTPLVILAFLFLKGNSWGIFSLAAGTIIGQIGEAVFLASALKAHGLHLWLSWKGIDTHVRRVITQCVPLAAGALISGGTTLVDQSMATMLPSGSVSALNYANRIVGAILGVGTLALGRAALPYLSGLAADKDWGAFRHTIRTYVRLIVLVTVPLAVLVFFSSRVLVRVLFEHGSFRSGDTAVVGPVLAFYSVQIPFYALGALAVSVLSSVSRNDILFYAAGVNVVLDIILNLLLMRVWGVAGIALSSSLVSAASLAFICAFIPGIEKTLVVQGRVK